MYVGPLPSGLGNCLSGRSVVIVSPHLDDAVLSAYMLMASHNVRIIEVATVITDVETSEPDDWSRVSGFTSAEEQAEARRNEDIAALTMLGRKFRHLGASSGRESEIARTLGRYIDSIAEEFPDAILMLPAGAGAGRPAGTLRRIARRLLGRPGGAMRHMEHISVRDHAVLVLRRHPRVSFGFYAEIPYIWSEDQTDLAHRLRMLVSRNIDQYVVRPTITSKLETVERYKSQIAPILGDKLSYRMKVLSHNEVYFMVSDQSHGRT